ncbi:MAK10-like protein [Tanacetum coccineum]
MGDANHIRTLGDYSKPSHEGYMNTIELPVGNNVVPLRSDTIRLVQNGCSFHELRSEDPNQHLKDFLKLVDSLDLDGENMERTRMCLFQFTLRNQASNWLERLPSRSITTLEDLTTRFLAQSFPPGRTTKLRNDILMFQQHQGEYLRSMDSFQGLTPKSPSSWHRSLAPMNKITSSCEICSGPHDTQYYMENPEQAFVEYASSRTDKAGGLMSNFMASQDARLSKLESDFKQQQSEMTNKIDTVLKAITDRIAGELPSDTVNNPKLNVNSTTSVLSAHSYPTDDPRCSTHIHDSINTITIHPEQQSDSITIRDDGDVMFIEIVKKNYNSRKEEPEAGGLKVEYFDIFPTWSELAYHKYLMCGPIPSIFLRNPIIMEGCPSNLKIPCNIRHVHVEKAYIDLNSPLNIMTRMMYNWIMRRKLDPRENSDRGVSNFMRRIKGMHVFVRNSTYATDFMIVEHISLIIDPRLSKVVLRKPFVEIYNMTHDPPEGVVIFDKKKLGSS